jgi:glycosyltransferase involved in cell wall biosynthesis
MSAGRPVIAPRLGVIEDYVDHSTAFLYAPTESTGLDTAFRDAVTSENLRMMGERARSKAAAQFNWGVVAEEFAAAWRVRIGPIPEP